MAKKWIAIDLLLLGIAGLLGWQLRISIIRFSAENDPARIRVGRDMRQRAIQATPPPQLAPLKTYIPAEFAIIPEKNIFSESRSKEEKTEAAVPPEPPPLAQKPVLVGVNITDNQKRAWIIDPMNSPQDRNRRAQVKRIGDAYQGYTITDITSDQIILESGRRKEIIPLHEGSKRNQAGKTPILSTRIVSIGGGGVVGGTPGIVVAGSPTPAAVAGARTPIAVGQQVTPSARQAAAAERAKQEVQPAQQQSPSTGTGSQGSRVIRTPFGDIIRPARD